MRRCVGERRSLPVARGLVRQVAGVGRRLAHRIGGGREGAYYAVHGDGAGSRLLQRGHRQFLPVFLVDAVAVGAARTQR